MSIIENNNTFVNTVAHITSAMCNTRGPRVRLVERSGGPADSFFTASIIAVSRYLIVDFQSIGQACQSNIHDRDVD